MQKIMNVPYIVELLSIEPVVGKHVTHKQTNLWILWTRIVSDWSSEQCLAILSPLVYAEAWRAGRDLIGPRKEVDRQGGVLADIHKRPLENPRETLESLWETARETWNLEIPYNAGKKLISFWEKKVYEWEAFIYGTVVGKYRLSSS